MKIRKDVNRDTQAGMDTIQMQPIGVIRSPYTSREDAPRQGVDAMKHTGTIELFDSFAEGARDITPGSLGQIVFYFHKSEGYSLITTSRKDQKMKGVFSTRSPFRPNAIGVSIVRFESVDKNIITFRGVDMLDGTPVLDIKPYDSGLELCVGSDKA